MKLLHLDARSRRCRDESLASTSRLARAPQPPDAAARRAGRRRAVQR